MRGQQADGLLSRSRSWVTAVIVSRKTLTMSGTGWVITGIIYLVLFFTLCILSFRKGHWVLGLIGFIFPVLWLVGAILPARRSR
jgi:hypothetical protein